MSMDIEEKVVVITGGKRIGRVVAQQIADRGGHLVLSYRGSKQEADDTVSDVNAPRRCAIAVARATPLGRWGGEIEIAKAVLSLIETDFITGETIRVDGGRHLG